MKRLLNLRRFMRVFLSQSTPPDLDQVWQDFVARVRSVLGLKKKQKSSDVKTPNNPKGLAFAFSLFLIIVLVIWLLTGVYIVGASQEAIELRFGRYTSTTLPGLHWHWPFPIESREVYDVTNVRTIQIGYKDSSDTIEKREATMLTDDENIINIQFSVQYVVRDVKDFAFNNSGLSDNWVKQAAESAMREVVGRHLMDYVLYQGRGDISEKCQELIQSILDRYQAGIRIVKVNLQNVQPPEEVQDAFSDAVKAVQDRERQKNEGQAYANSIIPRAQGNAARVLESAQAYAQRVVDVAQGDSRRFDQVFAEYKKSPEIMRDRLYLEALGHVLEKSTKVYVGTHSGQNVFYLPLDKIAQQKSSSDESSFGKDLSITSLAPKATDSSAEKTSFSSHDPESKAVLFKNRERGGR